jgi:hypothetical protein
MLNQEPSRRNQRILRRERHVETNFRLSSKVKTGDGPCDDVDDERCLRGQAVSWRERCLEREQFLGGERLLRRKRFLGRERFLGGTVSRIPPGRTSNRIVDTNK